MILRFIFTLTSIFLLLTQCKQSSSTSYVNTQSESPLESIHEVQDSPDRVVWQKPELVVNMLGDLKGKTVADLGAGTGYFAFRLLTKAEKVIALDIDKRAIYIIDSLKKNLPESDRARLITRLTPTYQAQLGENEADIILCVNTYSFISNRTAYFTKVLKNLKKNGTLLIVDYKTKTTPLGPPMEQRLDIYTVENEISKAGFIIESVDDTSLDYQYILKAKKP